MDVVEKQEVTTVETATPHQVVKTTTTVPPVVKTEHPQKVFETKKAIFRTHQVIWYILMVIEVLLAFRITLRALGASQTSGFTNAVYAISAPFAIPFSGILPVSVSGRAVFEWSTIIAAIVYIIVAFGITHLIQMLKPVTPEEVSESVDTI